MHYNFIEMDNPSLFEKKLSIINEVSSAIVATDNIKAISNLILDLAINYTNAQKGSLMLVNGRDELYILAARGMDIHFINNYRVKVGEGIAGAVAKDRVPVLVEDIEKDPRFGRMGSDKYKTRSFISCPIVSRNRLLGVLNINDKADGAFTEDELSLIKILSNQAAIVLEDAFLMNQLRAKASELEDINRKLIESDVVKTEFLTRVSHELRTPLNSIKGAIYYLQNTDQSARAEHKEFQSIIAGETDKLIHTVENLLDFVMLENEMRVIKKAVLNLGEILEKDIIGSRLLNVTISRRNFHLNTDIRKGVSDIVGDKIRVVQFFMNLIEGLSLYLENGDSISISLSEAEDVEVVILTSRKLPEAAIPFLFVPLQFSNTEEGRDRLKLYLASKTAEVHKWGLRAENTDKGFAISIKIPKSAKERVETVIDITMEKFMEFVSELLDVNTCSIMLADKFTGELTIKSARGLSEDVINRTRIKVGDSIAGWVALEGKPLLIDDLEKDPRFGRRSIPQYNNRSLLSLPLKAGDKVIGVLNLNNKKSAGAFSEQDLALAAQLSERISTFIDSLNSGDYPDEDINRFISSFDSLVKAEKGYRKRYQKKRGAFNELLVKALERLNAGKEDIETAHYVAMVYDLGLMVVDGEVLDKKSLTASEQRTIKAHPYNTLGLLSNFECSEKVKKIILHHHERWDGTGYPDKLKGEEIPFLSRVLSVIDAYSAMTSERPYRSTSSAAEALEELKKNSGSLYDPAIVKALEETLLARN